VQRRPRTFDGINAALDIIAAGRRAMSIDSDANPSFTAAIYHPSDRNLRAINIFGKWQLQHNSGEPSTREHDPWLNTGHRRDGHPKWENGGRA
jgi:hypothetical protein